MTVNVLIVHEGQRCRANGWRMKWLHCPNNPHPGLALLFLGFLLLVVPPSNDSFVLSIRRQLSLPINFIGLKSKEEANHYPIITCKLYNEVMESRFVYSLCLFLLLSVFCLCVHPCAATPPRGVFVKEGQGKNKFSVEILRNVSGLRWVTLKSNNSEAGPSCGSQMTKLQNMLNQWE